MIKATDLEENTKTIEPWKKDLNINEKKNSDSRTCSDCKHYTHNSSKHPRGICLIKYHEHQPVFKIYSDHEACPKFESKYTLDYYFNNKKSNNNSYINSNYNKTSNLENGSKLNTNINEENNNKNIWKIISYIFWGYLIYTIMYCIFTYFS